MPYICVNLSKKIDGKQEEELKARLGEIITLIPGKSEAVTMVDISCGRSLYLGGKALGNGAFVEIRLLGKAEKAYKEALTEAVFKSLKELVGASEKEVYVNVVEFENWGTGGKLI
jgi:phenylpyruvate tautomerase PptA (4-oxalocrotonate tautomerase family)